jgi:hypothetical protein
MNNDQGFGCKPCLFNTTLSKVAAEKELSRSLMPVVVSRGIEQMFFSVYEFKLELTAGYIKISEDLVEQYFREYNSALAERKSWFEVYSCRVKACFMQIDVGFTNFLTTLSGLLIKRQSFFKDGERKLKLLQQLVLKKKLGFNHWCKAQKKVLKQDEYVTNNQKDWHHKLCHQICQNVGIVFVENPDVTDLSRSMLWKHYLNTSWGQFFTILEQTCGRYGIYFKKVSTHNTNQVYPHCLTEIGKKQLNKRTHSYSNSGYTTDENVAATQVVLIKTLAAVGHTIKTFSDGKFIGIATNQ